ncbi:MAG: acetylglutamate kinase, partial [Flavisolibacter sp.]|nr:acetylglutamate kinase [Flavisolibacter sp.]
MDKLYVIKIGGNIIDDEEKLDQFLSAFSSISEKRILVHGGGKLATELAQKLAIPQQMIQGRRVTDLETLKLVTMVYGGWINKTIVARLQSKGVNALGLTGADAGIIKAHKRIAGEADYGFAGDVDEVNAPLLFEFLERGLTPVVAPITHDGRGQLLNTNADTIANSIAQAFSSRAEIHLIYCFEKEGVLGNIHDEASVIPQINSDNYHQLVDAGAIAGGMIPKIQNAIA